MSLADLKRSKSVLDAAKLCDRMGRDAFLKQYEFGRAKEYVVVINGRNYDSKAIAGVAHGLEFPQKGTLKASEFSGGERTVRRKLQQLGFIVRRNSEVPLVLVENEVTVGGHYDHWQDVTGERYHFPNQYKNLIVAGRPFVYYRGVRRKSGKRHVPEYFGRGFIGEIWRDPSVPVAAPKSSWDWFCAIQDYEEFRTPVPFKVDDQYLEQIPQNKFRAGVRQISRSCYELILEHASIPIGSLRESDKPPSLPGLDEIKIEVADDDHPLLASFPKSTKNESDGDNQSGSGRARRSPHATIIGNRAEEVALKHLSGLLTAGELKTLQSVAEDKYGWDIEYRSKNGAHVRIEVKGTSGRGFPNVEFTANEWSAARDHRASLWLYLVSHCLSTSPKIQKIKDPYAAYLSGNLEAMPLLWRLKWIKPNK